MPDAPTDKIAEMIALAPELAAALRDTPALIAHLEAQGYAVVPREPTEEMVERAVVAANKDRVRYMPKLMVEAALRAALNPEPKR